MARHAFASAASSSQGLPLISFKCQENRVLRMMHGADKGLTVSRYSGNASTAESPALEPPGRFLLQGPRGTGVPELPSHHTWALVPSCLLSELSSWPFACAPCLPALLNSMLRVQLLIHILPLLRGWWSCPLTYEGKLSNWAPLSTPDLRRPFQL